MPTQVTGPFLPAQMMHPSPLRVLETHSARWIMLMEAIWIPCPRSSTRYICQSIPLIELYHVAVMTAVDPTKDMLQWRMGSFLILQSQINLLKKVYILETTGGMSMHLQ